MLHDIIKNFLPTVQVLPIIPTNNLNSLRKFWEGSIYPHFTVSLIFQEDTSTSGGLNNQGLQITATADLSFFA
ncbi:MAG: hypothetical protein RBT65_09350 [Methanolobus sp.]|nr:hypothetical protein [Methanolobus sp.]